MTKPAGSNVMILGGGEKPQQYHRPRSPSEKRRLHACIAALNGDIPTLCHYLCKDEVNQQDEFGNTALMFAVMQGNITAVKTLLHMGANPYLTSPYNRHSPMTVAQTLKLREITHYMQAYWTYLHPTSADTALRKKMPAPRE